MKPDRKWQADGKVFNVGMNRFPEPEFPTSWEQILHRINAVNPVQYSRTRNFISGAVSYLSPYISRGVISTRFVLRQLQQNNLPFNDMRKWVSELAWRDYFQRIWQAKGDDIFSDLKQPQQSVMHHKMPLAITNAHTGIQAIDKGISTLYSTGYMHNHLRMYTASLACNIAHSHWNIPSRWMYYHLLDGDLASNTLSWQWVAGSFSSRKYYCNQENINRYTGTTQVNSFLDKPYEQLTSALVPEALCQIHIPDLTVSLPPSKTPVFDAPRHLVIYNSYNLDPFWRTEDEYNRVLLLEPSHFRRFPVSEAVIKFVVKLASNIPGIKIYTGEVNVLIAALQQQNLLNPDHKIISKEHPASVHYPGIRDERDWMVPQIAGYFPSFSAYWKKVEKPLWQSIG